MVRWYVFYAMTFIVGLIVQIILILLQARANRCAPHRSFKYILFGSFSVLLSIFIQYVPVFLFGMNTAHLVPEVIAWVIFVIGAVAGIIGAKLLFDRYVELANAERSRIRPAS